MTNGQVSRTVKCQDCGSTLPEDWSAKGDDERPPCPSCGSSNIHVSMELESEVRVGGSPVVEHEEALARWVLDLPVQHGLAVAVRAALRCLWFPICEGQHSEQLSLIGFRLSVAGVLDATSGDRSFAPSRALRSAVHRKQWRRSQSATLWRDLSRILVSNRHDAPEFTDAVVDLARHAADIIANPADSEDSWAELDADVRAIVQLRPDELMATRLFTPGASKYILDEVHHSNHRYRQHGLAFIADWYESILEGRVDTELLREIDRIPDDDWAKGGEHVAQLISTIEIARRLHDATPLAEEIVFDERSGKLRVEPVQMLPPSLYETGLDKLHDAVDDAHSASIRAPNSYTALHPTLEMLERTLSKYRENAQRVHDDQLLAVRKIQHLVDHDYVPDDDEVASLLQVLDTNAVDIRAAVPAVAAAVKKRSQVRIGELDQQDRDRIHAAVEAVASSSEEPLAEEMREDELATLEPETPLDVESPYRLTSRLAAVARTVRSLERIVGFAERHGPLIASFGNEALQTLAKLVGL